MLQACLRESEISLPPQRLHDKARALLEAADRDGNGSITFQELQQQLEAFPGLMESLTIRYRDVAGSVGHSSLFPPAVLWGLCSVEALRPTAGAVRAALQQSRVPCGAVEGISILSLCSGAACWGGRSTWAWVGDGMWCEGG